MKIYNALGPVHKEVTYGNAFEELLKQEKIPYTREPVLSLFMDDKKVGNYRPDFIVYDVIIVEFKSVDIIPRVFIKKIYQYLKSSQYKLAFMVNFGTTELQIIRRVYDSKRAIPHEFACHPMNPRMKGFTLLEILLFIAIISVVVGVAFPVSRAFQARNDLDIAATTAAQTLRRAQVLSQGMDGDISWGVRAQSGSITLFRGASYATRDASLDEVFDVPSTITPSGITEIVFAKFTGDPTTTGMLALTSSDNEVINITINAKGTVSY